MFVCVWKCVGGCLRVCMCETSLGGCPRVYVCVFVWIFVDEGVGVSVCIVCVFVCVKEIGKERERENVEEIE